MTSEVGATIQRLLDRYGQVDTATLLAEIERLTADLTACRATVAGQEAEIARLRSIVNELPATY